MQDNKINVDFQKMFEENCVIEKDGKKYLNEFGGIVICFMAISILNHIFKECGINGQDNKKSS